MHVVTLVVGLSTIPVFASVMVWVLDGTAAQIVQSAVVAWLLVQAIYVAQLVLRMVRREERKRDGAREPSVRDDRVNGPFADCDSRQHD